MEFLRRLYKKDIATKQTTGQQPKGSNKLEVLRRLLNYSLLVISVGILLIGGLWLFVWQQIDYDYDRTMAEASLETMNLTKAFEEHVRRVVADADKDLLRLKLVYEQEGLSSSSIIAYALNMAEDPSRSFVAIYNEQGVVVASYIQNALGVNLSDREYFQVHRNVAAEMLHIGKLIDSRLTPGKKITPLTRRINKPDGSFGGIVYIGLQVDYFLSFYNKIDLGQDQLITLTGMDGFLRARQTNEKVDFGQDVRHGELWKDNVQTGQPYGTFTTKAVIDGISRINSYRVLPEYPLIVAVGKSTQVAMAPFQQRKQVHILGALMVSLLIVVICGLLLVWVTKHQALIESKDEKYQQFFNSIDEGFFVIDVIFDENDRPVDMYYVEANAAATKILGQDFTGQRLREIDPNYEPDYYEIFGNVARTGESVRMEKFSVSDNMWFDFFVFKVGGKESRRIVNVFQDTTQRKRVEAELTHIDRINLVGEMAAGIGHEVRNPMTTVRGYLQWFNQKEAFADHRESFTIMIDELDRANAIITDFLSLAKDKRVDLVLTDLNKIVRSIFPLLQADAFLRGNEIELELLGILEILIDENEIRQCILNLACNGLDSMPDGGKVTISTKSVGNQVIMTVRDQGMGMTPEVKAKLWTPFFTTKDHGTGLGLPVCLQIAQRHDATIEVETGPGGTAFHFIFSQKKIVS